MSITDSAVTLRPATTEDEAFLLDLFREVHTPEFALLQLPAPALLPLLDMQFRGQAMTYAAQFPTAQSLVVEAAGTPLGRLLFAVRPDAIHLVDIALVATARGRGFGTSLLHWLGAQADAQGLPLRLQVRFGNPARRLYERLGFAHAGGDSMNLAMQRSPATLVEATAGTFRDLLGQYLPAYAPDGTGVPLLVAAVYPLDRPSTSPALNLGDSFVVELTGPHHPELAGTMARLITPDRRAFEVFLSPTSADPQHRYYEAVFNRSVNLA